MNDSFEHAIWLTLANIPEGKVVSYSGLAKLAGFTGRARQVGSCLRKLPKGSSLPWHRVVNAQREIAFPRATAKFREQKQRLLAEGVEFRGYKILPDYFL